MSFVLANIFQPLIDVADWILVQIHHVIPSWGLSIVLLTVLVRAALIPLTLKQFKSMQALQRLSPEIKELQKKYKDDKQRLNQEMMKFYQENKVNPLGSCLPLLLQLPVFLALFYTLQGSLRTNICGQDKVPCGEASPQDFASIGATPGDESFLFIPDLTNKATGWVLIVLILLYVGSQLLASLLMTVTADKTQRRLMMALPLVFIIFIINFPAGLIVYWITTNLWTIAQQYIVKKTVGPIRPPETAPAGAAALTGGGEKGGFLANLLGRGDDDGPTATKTKSTAKTGSGGAKGDGAPDRGAKKAPAGKGGGAKASAGGSKSGGGKKQGSSAKRSGPPPRPPKKRKRKRTGRRK
jgi:YidC/Oxa1 family membrane protein insertase